MYTPSIPKRKPAMNAATLTANQVIQEWGNGLGIRITAPVAKAAHFERGLPVQVEVVEGGVFLRVVGKPKLTLEQKLRQFDPARHGGEVMAFKPIGAEIIK
jgi:antitoxin MazE